VGEGWTPSHKVAATQDSCLWHWGSLQDSRRLAIHCSEDANFESGTHPLMGSRFFSGGSTRLVFLELASPLVSPSRLDPEVPCFAGILLPFHCILKSSSMIRSCAFSHRNNSKSY